MISPKETGRYSALDTLRGLCIISMVAFHAMYDVVYILGIDVPWFYSTPGYIWQQSICWCFILLSGFCWGFSHHPVKHGLIVLGGGCLVSLVTFIAMPSELILYGVLMLLGASALIAALFQKIGEKTGFHLPPAVGFALFSALFFITRGVPRGYLGFEGLRLFSLPSALYQWDALAWLGLPSPTFFSSDYFPLIPWLFLFFAGRYLYLLVGKSPRVMQRLRPGVRPLSFLGRHSLIIYLLHQPVLMGIFMLVNLGA